MLKEIILLVFGALCGLGVTLMAASAPVHFPNTPPWAVHAAFWSGIALVAIMILDGALLFLWQDTRPRLVPGIVINLALGAIALSLVWHYSPKHGLKQKGLPGFAAFAFVRLDNNSGPKDRYVFDQATSDGARVAFYQSESGLFIFSIKTPNGAFYHIEVPVGGDGLPVDRYVFLYCDAAVGKTSTFARVMIDGKEIRRRAFGFPMDFGKQDWEPMTVDSKGREDLPFKIAMFGVGKETFSDSDVWTHYAQFIQFLKDTAAAKAGSR